MPVSPLAIPPVNVRLDNCTLPVTAGKISMIRDRISPSTVTSSRPGPDIVTASVTSKTPIVSEIVWGVPKTVGLKVIVSAPGLPLAALMASRRLTSPSDKSLSNSSKEVLTTKLAAARV